MPYDPNDYTREAIEARIQHAKEIYENGGQQVGIEAAQRALEKIDQQPDLAREIELEFNRGDFNNDQQQDRKPDFDDPLDAGYNGDGEPVPNAGLGGMEGGNEIDGGQDDGQVDDGAVPDNDREDGGDQGDAGDHEAVDNDGGDRDDGGRDDGDRDGGDHDGGEHDGGDRGDRGGE